MEHAFPEVVPGVTDPFVFAIRSDVRGIIWYSDCKASSCPIIEVPGFAAVSGESITFEIASESGVLGPSHIDGTFAGNDTTFPVTRRKLAAPADLTSPFVGGFRGFRASMWNEQQAFEPDRLLSDLSAFTLLDEARRLEIAHSVFKPRASVGGNVLTGFAPAWLAPGDVAFVAGSTMHAATLGTALEDDDEETSAASLALGGVFGLNYIRLSGTKSFYVNGSVGIKGVPFGIGLNITATKTDTTTDLLDLSGDGIPDLITSNDVRLGRLDASTAGGGLTAHDPGGAFRRRDGKGYSLSIDGGPEAVTTAAGRMLLLAVPGGVDSGIGFTNGTGFAIGRSQTTSDLADLNGDGLADLIRRDGQTVYVRYNLGHRFGAEEPFGQVSITEAVDDFEAQVERPMGFDSTSHALTHETTISRHSEEGFKSPVFSVSAGERSSVSATTRQLADLNGDSLPDLLFKRDGEDVIVVQFNQRVVFHAVSWADYEAQLEIRGEKSVPRITYFRGTLELTSPSRDHERITSWIGRLIEVYVKLPRFGGRVGTNVHAAIA